MVLRAPFFGRLEPATLSALSLQVVLLSAFITLSSFMVAMIAFLGYRQIKEAAVQKAVTAAVDKCLERTDTAVSERLNEVLGSRVETGPSPEPELTEEVSEEV